MSRYYLRVEAINLGNFIDDTQDLSTIRGASLVLLDMVEKLTTKHHRLERISTGASTGLFSFDAADSAAADLFRKKIEDDLRTDYCIKHATFAVDVLRDSGDFQADRERLIAMNRWRQMRQPSVAVPAQNQTDRQWIGDKSRYAACEIDHVRVATAEMPGPGGKPQYVSESVKARRSFGRLEKKGAFYQDQAGVVARFTKDFEELTSADGSTGELGNLDGKMAVIYLDGNGFGKRHGGCGTVEDLKRWDQAIQGKRKAVLTGLLNRMRDEEAGRGWRRSDGGLRIETLLWGGDDLLWVVPAWKGIETLIHFFRFREHKDRPFWEFEGTPLTHAVGVVFCHRKAPIYRIRRLAEKLAGLAKDKARDQNLVAYEVLESFDHAGTDLDRHRTRWFPWASAEQKKELAKQLILPGDALQGIDEPIRLLKKGFPRKQLHRIVQGSLESPEEGAMAAREVIETLDQTVRAKLTELEPCFGTTMARWVHLSELWDYII